MVAKKKILICDDSVTMQKAIALALKKEALDLIFCDNGKDALRLAEHHHPALMLVDSDMPIMTGLELCRAVRAHPILRHTRLVLMCGSFDQIDEASIKQAQVDARLWKPFEAHVLTTLIKTLDAAPTAAATQFAEQTPPQKPGQTAITKVSPPAAPQSQPPPPPPAPAPPAPPAPPKFRAAEILNQPPPAPPRPQQKQHQSSPPPAPVAPTENDFETKIFTREQSQATRIISNDPTAPDTEIRDVVEDMVSDTFSGEASPQDDTIVQIQLDPILKSNVDDFWTPQDDQLFNTQDIKVEPRFEPTDYASPKETAEFESPMEPVKYAAPMEPVKYAAPMEPVKYAAPMEPTFEESPIEYSGQDDSLYTTLNPESYQTLPESSKAAPTQAPEEIFRLRPESQDLQSLVRQEVQKAMRDWMRGELQQELNRVLQQIDKVEK